VGRDDLAIKAISANLANYLSEEIPNPVIYGRLDEGWDDPERPCRQEFVTAAIKLQRALEESLSQQRATQASAQLRELFGRHFPSDVSLLVEEDSPVEFKSAAASASAAIIGISAAEQAARAQSAASALRTAGLATKPWGSASDE
jgi:hypothetical protein